MQQNSIQPGQLHESPRRGTSFVVGPQVRSAHDDDGLVLLSSRTGHYFSFNAVGGLVWSKIEEGASAAAIIRAVQERFEAPSDLVERDVESILARLERDRLIVRASRAADGAPPRAAAALAPTPAATAARPSSHEAAIHETVDRTKAGRRGGGQLFRDVVAFLTLVYVDVSIKLFKFPRLDAVLRKRASVRRRTDPATVQRISRSVDRAAAAYFKRAWCLQRSAACAYLLRRRGCPAQLVLGVRTLPFEAHAWVEVDGRVVNDRPEHIQRYLVLDRI